jgi:hypothetical protein
MMHRVVQTATPEREHYERKRHPHGGEQSDMIERVTETTASVSQRNMSGASAYSAHIQAAMRYDRLRSSEYLLVMTILHALLQGYTYERWQEEQQRSLQALQQRSPDPHAAHADAENRYEQTVRCLQDLQLWPW